MSDFIPLPEEVKLLQALRGTPNGSFHVRVNEYGKIIAVKVEQILTENIVAITKTRQVIEIKQK